MLKKEQAQPEKKYLSISLNRIFWSMKIRFSARRVLSRISFDMNWRKISRCKSRLPCGPSYRRFYAARRKHCFVRTVCGLLVKSVEPEDTSLTHTNAVELCMRASASSKPSKLLTRQNLKFFDRASLLVSVSRRKKSAASQLNDLLSILFL